MRLLCKHNFLIAAGLSLLMIACHSNQQQSSNNASIDEISRDLSAIKKDGVLNVITLYNSTSYFVYRGEPMGFDFEMAKRLSKNLKLQMHIVVANSFDDIFGLLNSGVGDIIASGITITSPRKKKVAFTDYLYVTHQVLVQRKPRNWRRLPEYKIKRRLVNNPIELIGDTVYIRKGTSYYARLKNLEKEIGGKIVIKPVGGDKSTDDLIRMVVDGKINYTVADYNLAAINKTFYPILDINTPVSFSQRIAWAVRKTSPKLLKAVNKWVKAFKKKDLYYVLYDKYFKDKKGYRRRITSDLFSKNEGIISRYDKLIRKYSKKLGWDWRLVASLIYQESRFIPNDTSWSGAGGLMQIMPATAKQLGVKNITNPEANIRAGTTYLKMLYNRFDMVRDSIQRIKFTLAAYNCGLGHVRDAQRLAKALGLNPHRWDGNAEKAILKLEEHKYFTMPEVHHGIVRGSMPYHYVREIFRRYDYYRELIPLKAKPKSRAASD
jgi:membrane-bound lytic murein transglycosylase F